MSLRDQLAGVVVMGPMTKGSNLPYRRLCTELGARVLVSEMTVARRLKQKRRSEFALIRRFPGEPCFGVQLAGTNPEEMGWAAALVASRGADFVSTRDPRSLGEAMKTHAAAQVRLQDASATSDASTIVRPETLLMR